MSKGSTASITIVGNIGQNVKITPTNSGNNIARFSVGTTATVYKDNGFQDVTTWFNVSFFSKSAKYLEGFTKGTKIAVTGELHLDTWVDRNGIQKPSLNVQAHDAILLGSSKPKGDVNGNVNEDLNDDIPF
jgi:single-strand DNA-binding protein